MTSAGVVTCSPCRAGSSCWGQGPRSRLELSGTRLALPTRVAPSQRRCECDGPRTLPFYSARGHPPHTEGCGGTRLGEGRSNHTNTSGPRPGLPLSLRCCAGTWWETSWGDCAVTWCAPGGSGPALVPTPSGEAEAAVVACRPSPRGADAEGSGPSAQRHPASPLLPKRFAVPPAPHSPGESHPGTGRCSLRGSLTSASGAASGSRRRPRPPSPRPPPPESTHPPAHLPPASTQHICMFPGVLASAPSPRRHCRSQGRSWGWAQASCT